MPMPGDNSFGRKKGSYTPGDDQLDNTPFKPVPLAFQTNETADTMDANANMRSPARRTQSQQEEQQDKRKRIFIIAAVIITLLIILAIILPLAICFGTDHCSSSEPKSEPSRSDHQKHQARLKAEMAAPVISQPGNDSFEDHLIRTLDGPIPIIAIETNSTISNTSSTTVASIRRKRTANSEASNNRSMSVIDRYSADKINVQVPLSRADMYLAEKISAPLFESIKSSALCKSIDCSDLVIDHLRLPENNLFVSTFNFAMDSNQPISIKPQMISDISDTVVKNFAKAFADAFPGYSLGDVDLAFDLESFCNYTSVKCVDFPDINDAFPTPPQFPPTTSTVNGSTADDRSVLLPDLVQIFNDSIISTSTPVIGPMSTPVARMATRPLADCSKYGFVCADQRYRVGSRQRCDGIIQCADGSDEHRCDQCRTSFACPSNEGGWMCRSGKILCDGKAECITQVDESLLHCKPKCLASEYNCRDSRICIPRQWVCDGDTQCPSGDDESDCKLPHKCQHDAFFCKSDSRCISSWLLCNGIPDCTDRSDEEGCSCVECSGNSTALCSAPTGRCIQRRQICDGRLDCPFGEDEFDCQR